MDLVWGTGKISTRFCETMERYKSAFPSFVKQLIPNIEFFLDIDAAKTGSVFFGKPVKKPDETIWLKKDVRCIVAVAKSEIVINEMKNSYGIPAESLLDYRRVFMGINNALADRYSQERFEIHDTILRRKVSVASIIKSCLENQQRYSGELEDYSPYEIMDAFIFLYGTDGNKLLEMVKKADLFKQHIGQIKHVAMVSATFSLGGAEKVVSNLIPLFIDKGYEVSLISRDETEDDYELDARANRLNVFSSINIFNPEWNFRKFEEAIEKSDIDAVCFHNPYVGVEYLCEVIILRIMRKYVITECHTSFNRFMKVYAQRMDYSVAYSFSDAFVVLDENEKTKWNQLGLLPVAIRNPVDKMNNNTMLVKAKSHKRSILWVGRIMQEAKQVLETVRIMKALCAEIPDAHLTILGKKYNENDYEALNKAICDSGLKENIEICEFTPDPEEYYKKADIVLVTSEDEGFSMVLLESKSYGIPVVMYDIPHLPFVRDGRGIVTVNQKDAEGAAEKIIELLNDSDIYNRVSNEAIESFDDYKEEDIGEKWSRLFKSICDHADMITV